MLGSWLGTNGGRGGRRRERRGGKGKGGQGRGGERRDSTLRVDVGKAVYRLARGHQILEGEGDLGSPLPKKNERIGLYSSAARYVTHKPGLHITWPAWN